MTNEPTLRPLRPGTLISYAGMQATVVADYGAGSVDVLCEGFLQPWHWTHDGETCQVVSVPQGKASYATFDDYVKDFAQAEEYRAWITNHGHDSAMLFKLTDPRHLGSPHGGVTGNYMWAALHIGLTSIRIAAHDCDDGLMVRDFDLDQMDQAETVLAQMRESAPFSMWEAADLFGFKWY
jgi:hypothetical protein